MWKNTSLKGLQEIHVRVTCLHILLHSFTPYRAINQKQLNKQTNKNR